MIFSGQVFTVLHVSLSFVRTVKSCSVATVHMYAQTDINDGMLGESIAPGTQGE